MKNVITLFLPEFAENWENRSFLKTLFEAFWSINRPKWFEFIFGITQNLKLKENHWRFVLKIEKSEYTVEMGGKSGHLFKF